MESDQRTFADFERDAEQVIKQIADWDVTALTARIEKFAEHLERCLTVSFSDGTPFDAQWSIVTLHKIFVALGGRLVQIESTVTEDSELTFLVPRLSIAFDRLTVRVVRFCDAYAKFEALTTGIIN